MLVDVRHIGTTAHYRVAARDASLGAPEVNLGILPGAGGTQRLPRVMEAGAAVRMLLEGKPVDAVSAASVALVDRVADGDVVQTALRFISETSREPRPSIRRAVGPDVEAALRRAPDRPTAAQQAILTCMGRLRSESAETGPARKAVLFDELAVSDTARALRHAFTARRQATRIAIGDGSEALPIDTVTVVGAGSMGTGISLACMRAGKRVVVIDPNDGARERAAATVANVLRRDVGKGRLTQSESEAQLGALRLSPNIAECRGSQLIIEAIVEDLSIKRAVFAEMDRVADPQTFLASNTSTLNLNEIAAATSRAQRIVGLHFFNPAHVMRLLEIVRGTHTSEATLAMALEFAKSLGKTGVVAGVCDGFIGNRMFEEYLRQAYLLVEEGALPQQVDRVLEAWGMSMGPFRTMDLAGQDIGYSIRARRARSQPERPYSKFPDRICELGRLGQKSGAGVYLYPDGRNPRVDPIIDELAYAESKRLGVTRREVSDTEITERCILAVERSPRSIEVDLV